MTLRDQNERRHLSLADESEYRFSIVGEPAHIHSLRGLLASLRPELEADDSALPFHCDGAADFSTKFAEAQRVLNEYKQAH